MGKSTFTTISWRKVLQKTRCRRKGRPQRKVRSFEREIPFHCRVQCSMWLVLVLFVSSDFVTSDGVLALDLQAKPCSGEDQPVSPAPEA